MRGGPRSRSWDCWRCKRTLSSKLSGTVLGSHSGDNGQSKVWGKDKRAVSGEGRLSKDNGELTSLSACSGLSDSPMVMGSKACVEVGDVGGGDIGVRKI